MQYDLVNLEELYREKGAGREETEAALRSCRAYLDFLSSLQVDPDQAGRGDLEVFFNTLDIPVERHVPLLTALARFSYLSGNNSLYLYLAQVLERGTIIANIKDRILETLGSCRGDAVYEGLAAPPPAAAPDAAPAYSEALLSRLLKKASPEEAARALCGNAHGIPAAAFDGERKAFLEAADLETYLEEAHERAVSVLEEHVKNGRPWFEQEITPAVVEFIKSRREVLGGVAEGNAIFWTKIPYDPAAWLSESDPRRRRYLACHCPMVRESLNPETALQEDGSPVTKIDPVWCSCTAGFIMQRFNAVFGRETKVELLESVLGGAELCRFAVTIPEGVPRR